MTKKQLREKFNVWLGYQFDAQNKKSSSATHRWLFCWDGVEETQTCFDCACCLNDKEHPGCGCVCHVRIGQIVDFFWSKTRARRRKSK